MALTFEKVADAPYEAFVLWWDSSTLAVYCPLCSEVECHDTKSEDGKFNWDEPLTLTAPCRSTGVTYQAFFPWKMGLGWEKNWERKRLDTVGLDLSKLEIQESWQPASMAMSRPLRRAREDPLFWAGRMKRDQLGDSLLYPDGRQNRRSEASEAQREKRRSTDSTLGLEKPVLPVSPRTVLGDMRLMTSHRPKSNWIKILAPAASIDRTSMPGPLALISSHKLLKHKTVAVLDRKGPYAPIIAVSGWKDSLSGADGADLADNIINQDFWSREVQELVQYISHKPEAHNLDLGTEGRIYASHAEKQVMAYFVRMHCFLEDGYEEIKMDRLKMLPPHAGLREAWIAVDRSPCKDCNIFKREIEAVCRVKFHFVRMQDDFRFKKDRRIEDIEALTTPIRLSTAKFPLLTPPDSGSQRSQKYQKRPRSEASDESYKESYDELESSPTPSPTRRSPLRAKRSRRSGAPASESLHPLQTSSHEQRQHRYDRLSPADVVATIDEVADSIAEEEQEEFQQQEDSSTDSDTPIIARKRGIKKASREKIVIDLTGNTTDDDDDSDGSCFSP
jgi:hypothetical protein